MLIRLKQKYYFLEIKRTIKLIIAKYKYQRNKLAKYALYKLLKLPYTLK